MMALKFIQRVLLLLALPALSWASDCAHARAYTCEETLASLSVQYAKPLHSADWNGRHASPEPLLLESPQVEPSLRLTSQTVDVPIQQMPTTRTKRITVTFTTDIALPVRVWRLNHWYDWVKAISQGPHKAAPPDSSRHGRLSAYAGQASAKKSWRPAQAQQRRSVLASARSRAYV